ncbi:unnamed protein product [Ilex paraguariensis]|uniref:F-box domain-containing protein n=1 Tax=Ilex paraguariensis TaxID=185542 RepID=A0ABC8V579_9AQUA
MISKKLFAGVDPPEDVILDILMRLPMKSLMRLSCVSKSWNAFLTNPNFFSKQLHRSSATAHKLLILTRSELGFGFYFHSPPDDGDGDNNNNVPLNIPQFSLPDFSIYSLYIQGSCNGLACLSVNDTSTVVLWNPVTRQFRPIRVPFPRGRPNHPFEDPGCSLFGFGFIPRNNGYKVVRITPLVFPTETIRTWVYTLSLDSWKEKKVAVPDVIFKTQLAICVNGFLHWLAYNKSTKVEVIVLFDLDNEVFRQIALPDSYTFQSKIDRKLVILKGSFSVMIHDPSRRLEIWTMTEYGDEKSWTLQLTVGAFPEGLDYPSGVSNNEYGDEKSWTLQLTIGAFPEGLDYPSGVSNNGEIIFRSSDCDSNSLFLYDPRSRTIKHIPGQRRTCPFEAVNYVMSLVSVQGGRKRIPAE